MKTQSTLLAASAAALLLCVAPSPAWAGDQCMGVSHMGECTEDGVRWCSDGKIKEVKCAEGEICAKHAAYDGGYGCVDKELTDCAGIPDAGSCTTANALVWCNYRGELIVQECAADEICAYDVDLGYMECLPASEVHEPSATPEPDPGGQGTGDPEAPELPEDPAESDDPTVPPRDNDDDGDGATGPLPTIEPHEDQPLAAGGGGVEGCATGSTPSTWLWTLAVLGLLALRRRG